MKPIVGVNYYLSKKDYDDAVFLDKYNENPCSPFLRKFKRWMELHYDVEIHTYDCIDVDSPSVKAVLYFDYNWRSAFSDPFLKRIPFGKRALMLIEPANVNPTLYYIPFFRNRFKTIFTWDEKLLRNHPDYVPVNVPVGAEPSLYKENPFSNIQFSTKKLLVAISRNRWSYMPNSTYRLRKKIYSFFDKNYTADFDLFGANWNQPAVFYEKWFGFPRYCCYRGELGGDYWNGKVAQLAKYKFAICYENNASQPGYISEKIIDCLCARCVPIYYGSKGVERRIPQECWIDAHQFRNLREMGRFLANMTSDSHAQYIDAINSFMRSKACDFFSTDHYFHTLAKGLALCPTNQNTLQPILNS